MEKARRMWTSLSLKASFLTSTTASIQTTRMQRMTCGILLTSRKRRFLSQKPAKRTWCVSGQLSLVVGLKLDLRAHQNLVGYRLILLRSFSLFGWAAVYRFLTKGKGSAKSGIRETRVMCMNRIPSQGRRTTCKNAWIGLGKGMKQLGSVCSTFVFIRT